MYKDDDERSVFLVVELLEVVLNDFEVLKRIYEHEWMALYDRLTRFLHDTKGFV